MTIFADAGDYQASDYQASDYQASDYQASDYQASDYETFEQVLAEAVERTGTQLLTYTLMPNR